MCVCVCVCVYVCVYIHILSPAFIGALPTLAEALGFDYGIYNLNRYR